MTKQRKSIWLCLLCCLALLLGTQAVAADPVFPDNSKEFAAISDEKVSSKTVKPGKTLTYSLTITDQNAGSYYAYCDGGWQNVSYIQITWKSPKKQTIVKKYDWEKTSAVEGQHKITDKIKIKNGMEPGKWKIDRIDLYSADPLDDGDVLPILNKSLHKRKASATPVIYADLSALDFTIKGSKADKQAPKVNMSSLSLSKKRVKYNQKVKFSVKVTDISEIKYVKCTWTYAPNKNKKWSCYDEDYEMKYNKGKKRYECILRGGQSKKSSTRLLSIRVCDIYGNKTLYTYDNSKYKNAIAKMIFYRK